MRKGLLSTSNQIAYFIDASYMRRLEINFERAMLVNVGGLVESREVFKLFYYQERCTVITSV